MKNDFLSLLIEKGVRSDVVTPHDLSFGVIPKINATCRSGNQEAKEIVFNSFCGLVAPEEALKVANKCHREQKNKISIIFDELNKQVDNSHKVIVVFGEKENVEFNGLAANQLLSKYNKPIIVLREQNSTTYSGSVRSNFDTLNAINATQIGRCQGHERAHGIVIKKAMLDKLIQWFDDNEELQSDPEIEVFTEITPQDITLALCEELEKYEYLWGEGIKKPLFYCKIIANADECFVFRKRTITGKINSNGVSFIKFNIDEEDAKKLESGIPLEIDAIISLTLNQYEGIITPQANVEKWEIHELKNDTSWEDIF